MQAIAVCSLTLGLREVLVVLVVWNPTLDLEE